MKKNVFFRQRLLSAAEVLLLAAMMSAPFTVSAQVTIGSGDLPQATLDIIRHNPSETGKAFRLDDGNQAPGKVLTCGENGVGTWQPSGTFFRRGTVQFFQDITVNMSDYPVNPATWYTVNNSYIDLEPGTWNIEFNLPYRYNFECSTSDWFFLQIGLIEEGTTTDATHITQFHNGPFLATRAVREPVAAILNNNSGTTKRYYLCFGRFDSSSPALLNNPVVFLPSALSLGGHITAILISD